jgi:hypothetical protein
MARRKAFDCPTCKERRELERDRKRQDRNAEAYNCVQKIVQDGCPKKSSAVSEAAKALKRSDTAIWTSLREHGQELERQAQELEHRAKEAWEEARRSARNIRIWLGEEEPTDEEVEAAGDQSRSFLDDLRKGK